MSHLPQRSCIGCRAVRDKRDLLRIVHTPEGAFHADEKGTAAGRGAYLCRSRSCFEAAFKKGALARSFRCEVTETVKANLWQELQEIEQKDF